MVDSHKKVSPIDESININYPKQKDSGLNCLKDTESIQNLSICSGLMVTKALFFLQYG